MVVGCDFSEAISFGVWFVCVFFVAGKLSFFFPKFAGPSTHGRPSCNVPSKFEGVFFHSFLLVIWVYTPMPPQPETSIEAWCFLLLVSLQIQPFVFSNNRDSGNGWLVVCIPGIPLWKGLGALGAGPNPSHQFTICWVVWICGQSLNKNRRPFTTRPGNPVSIPNAGNSPINFQKESLQKETPIYIQATSWSFFLRMEILTTQM